jgi:hypothetical protein
MMALSAEHLNPLFVSVRRCGSSGVGAFCTRRSDKRENSGDNDNAVAATPLSLVAGTSSYAYVRT